MPPQHMNVFRFILLLRALERESSSTMPQYTIMSRLRNLDTVHVAHGKILVIIRAKELEERSHS